MKNTYTLLITLFFAFVASNLFAQVKMGDNPGSVDASAVLEIESTGQTVGIRHFDNTASFSTQITNFSLTVKKMD